MIDTNYDNLQQGQRLKEARKLTLLSRRAFAKKYNFNISSYQAWEDGKYKKGLGLANASKVVQAFAVENIDCSIEWLLYGTGDVAIRKVNFVTSKFNHTPHDKIKQNVLDYQKVKAFNFKLINAIKNNKVEECRMLVASGANLHTLNNMQLYLYTLKQYTALHLAALYGSATLIQLFIGLHVNPNIRNRDNDVPLHLASWEGNEQAIKKLISLGASIEATNNEGTTPLMWAASNGQVQSIKALCSHGAHLNYNDYRGNTAIHWAAFKGHAGAIHALYKAGAYLDIDNHLGQTPLDLAVLNGQNEAVDAILSILGKI